MIVTPVLWTTDVQGRRIVGDPGGHRGDPKSGVIITQVPWTTDVQDAGSSATLAVISGA